jgi:type IV secretion system protein VirD4
VFVIIRGARPLRCGRAIYFRRPELAERVAANRFNANSAAAAD